MELLTRFRIVECADDVESLLDDFVWEIEVVMGDKLLVWVVEDIELGLRLLWIIIRLESDFCSCEWFNRLGITIKDFKYISRIFIKKTC